MSFCRNFASLMQDYGGGVSSKTGEYRETGADGGRERNMHQEGYQPSQHQYAVMQSKNYGRLYITVIFVTVDFTCSQTNCQ